MTLEDVKLAFDKFYNSSPFVGRGDTIRLAMEGAFMAGYTLLGEELIALDKKLHDKSGTH